MLKTLSAYFLEQGNILVFPINYRQTIEIKTYVFTCSAVATTSTI